VTPYQRYLRIHIPDKSLASIGELGYLDRYGVEWKPVRTKSMGILFILVAAQIYKKGLSSKQSTMHSNILAILD